VNYSDLKLIGFLLNDLVDAERRKTTEFEGVKEEEAKILDLTIQNGQNCKQFWNVLGLIQVSFYRMRRLDDLIKKKEESENELDRFEDIIFSDANSLIQAAVYYFRDLKKEADIHDVYFGYWQPSAENFRKEKTNYKKI
jgi:hypothetical protein